MRIALLTDNDFDQLNGETTTLRAVLRHAPADVAPHVYTLAGQSEEAAGYTALPSRGMPIPFYRDMRIYAPRFRTLGARLRDDKVSAIHLMTPGPAGIAARQLAGALKLPLVGSYHTELGEYAARLSGSRCVGSLMQAYVRWVYRRCTRVLVPSESTRRHLVEIGWPAEKLGVWTRGVDCARFSPARRSAALRTEWQVSDRRPALLYAGRLSREKGLALLGAVRALLDQHRMPHRFIICGDGPMSGLLVLVTDRGGPRENMIDRTTGYICHAGSEHDFCCRAGELLTDGSRRTAMGAAAAQYARTRAWHAALQPLFDVYREFSRSAWQADAVPRSTRTAYRALI